MSSEKHQFRPARVRISMAAMKHNLAVVRSYCPDTEVMAVIKADGYGHGMEVAADALNAADRFGVNGMDDVLRLRHHGVTAPIDLLSASYHGDQLRQMPELNVRPVVYDATQLDSLESIPESLGLFVWLKIDTGMGRLGFSVSEIDEVYQRLLACTAVAEIGLMSHLANADKLEHKATVEQINQCHALAERHAFSAVSLLNSAGVIGNSNAAMDVVRPGAMLYGISPIIGQSSVDLDLQAAMTFESELISVKAMPAGSPIGYSGTHVLEKDTTIGVVGCGYGDGYPRHAKDGTPVVVKGAVVPLIGRVSMDMLVVDLGNLAATTGDPVILWGPENPVETVAECAGTIGYELVCGILPRVQRLTI